MSDTGYLISEAAKITEVDAHVLRYWEEELELPIARNKMGHRYYTRQDIQIFQDIKELKKKGLQLRAIREILHQRMEAAGTVEKQKQLLGDQKEREIHSSKVVSISSLDKLPSGTVGFEEDSEDKLPHELPQGDKGRERMKTQRKEKPKGKEGHQRREKSQEKDESNDRLRQKKNVEDESPETEQLLRQRQFQEILERLVKQVIMANHQEGRYKRLDAAIRRHQESRRLVAATEEERKKRRNGKKVKCKNRTASGGNDS